MNRNQKIALGCGGAGCLGLIVVVIAGLLIYFFAYNSSSNRNYNFNRSTNRNSNTNDNSDFSTNANDNDNSSDSSDSADSSSASSMSEDDKHKLYQAAAMTGDTELVRRVSVKLGLIDEDFTPRDNYQAFLTAHIEWVMRNPNFIRSISDAEKARAYVNENLPG